MGDFWLKNYELFLRCLLWSILLVVTGQPVLGLSQDAAHSCPGIGTAVRIDEPSQDIDFAYSRGNLFKMDNLGLTIWSLEDPDSPRMISAVPAGRGVGYDDYYFFMRDRLELDNRGFGYVVEEGGGVSCFDLRFPAHPRKLWTSTDLQDPFLSVAIAVNDTTLTSQSPEGIFVDLIDVSDPYHPVLLESLPELSIMSSLEMSGDILFVLAQEPLGGLHVYDVGDPNSPLLLGVFPEYFFDQGNIWGGVWAGDSKALVHSFRSKLAVVDFSDKENIVLSDISDSVSMYWIEEAVWNGSDAYAVGQEASDGRRGFFKFDLENPTDPVMTFESEAPRAGWGSLTNTEDRLYRADYSSTIAAYGLRPGLPQTLPGIPAGRAEQMVVDGAFGYVADGNAGLAVLNLGNPLSPSLVARYPLPGYAMSLVVRNDLVYLASGDAGLLIVDVRNPREPKMLSALDLAYDASSLDVSEGLVVVTTEGSPFGMSFPVDVVDVSDPRAPSYLATIVIESDSSVHSNSSGVAIDDQIAWVAALRTLTAIDISEPSAPKVVGELELLPANSHGGLADVAFLDGMAIVTGWWGQPSVVDISDPENPILHSVVNGAPSSVHVSTSGSTAVIGGRETTVIDFSDLDEPLVRSMQRIREGNGSTIRNGVLYSTAAPFIDVFTLQCRTPIADYRYHSSGQNYWFTNTSQYYFDDVVWDFGDGSEPSSDLNPSHRFPSTGEFTVTLQISGDQGNDSVSRIITVSDIYLRKIPDRQDRK